MQSFLQYRRLGQAVRKQIGGDQEKASSISDEGWKTQQAPESCRSSTTLSNSHPIENVSRDLHSTPTNWTVRTHRSTHECTGQSLTGIHARERTTHEGKGSKVLVVDWTEDDRENPRSWSVVYRVWVTLILASISFVVGAASSTDTAILPQAAAEFDVSAVVESLAIGTTEVLLPQSSQPLTRRHQVFTLLVTRSVPSSLDLSQRPSVETLSTSRRC